MWKNNSMDVKNKFQRNLLFLFLYKNKRYNFLAHSRNYIIKRSVSQNAGSGTVFTLQRIFIQFVLILSIHIHSVYKEN